MYFFNSRSPPPPTKGNINLMSTYQGNAQDVKLTFPDIEITQDCIYKMEAWTAIAPGEWSCMGLVEETVDDSGNISKLLINEIFFVEQLNTGSNTELDDDGLAKLVCELVGRDNGDEGRLKAWIHSHASMAVFWSATDDDTCAKLVGTSGTYLVSVVVNKQKESRVRLDLAKPRITIDNIGYKIKDKVTNPFYKECEEIYKAKAKNVGGALSLNSHEWADAAAYDHAVGDDEAYAKLWMQYGGKGKSNQASSRRQSHHIHHRAQAIQQQYHNGGYRYGVTPDGAVYPYPHSNVTPAVSAQHNRGVQTPTNSAQSRPDHLRVVKAAQKKDKPSSSANTEIEAVDVYDVSAVLAAFSAISEYELSIANVAWQDGLIDDDKYEELVNALVHQQALENLLGESIYRTAELMFLNQLGDAADVLTGSTPVSGDETAELNELEEEDEGEPATFASKPAEVETVTDSQVDDDMDIIIGEPVEASSQGSPTPREEVPPGAEGLIVVTRSLN